MFEHAAPKFSPEEAAAMALAHWGLAVSARPVDSYLDQNFRLDSDQGRFVLKIANAAAEDEYVTFQQDTLCFLEDTHCCVHASLHTGRCRHTIADWCSTHCSHNLLNAVSCYNMTASIQKL